MTKDSALSSNSHVVQDIALHELSRRLTALEECVGREPVVSLVSSLNSIYNNEKAEQSAGHKQAKDDNVGDVKIALLTSEMEKIRSEVEEMKRWACSEPYVSCCR